MMKNPSLLIAKELENAWRLGVMEASLIETIFGVSEWERIAIVGLLF